LSESENLDKTSDKKSDIKPSESTKNTKAEEAKLNTEFQDWFMESTRIELEDPLLECLVILSKENGRRTSIAALAAGLPLSKEGFASPGLFVRAAERVNLSAKLLRRDLKYIVRSPSLPCILILENRQACILRSFSKEKGVVLTFPERPKAEIFLTVKELNERYKGYAFFLSTKVRVDERAGPSVIDTEKDWFWGEIKRHKTVYIQVMLAALLINLFALVSPIFIMNVYDRILPNQAFDTLWVLAIGASLAMCFDFILKNLRSHFLDAAGRKSDIRISSNIFERIQGMKMSARPPSSGMLAENMREFETLRDFFTSATVTTLVDFPFVLLFIFLMWILGGSIVYVPIVIASAILIFGLILQKPLSRIIEENAREGAYKSSILVETLNGLETIKIQAAEGHNQRKWEEIVEQSSLTSVKARYLSSLAINFTSFGAIICSIVVVLYGSYLVADKALTTGGLIAAVMLSGRIISPLAQMASILTRFNQSKTSLKRLNYLMKSPVEREANKSFISKGIFEGKITFRDLTFRYPGKKIDTLKNINMEINTGDHVGIIGSIGSGKTTLQRLLLNLYQPINGSVEIDGLDVRQIEPGDLRRNIGVVQQDAYMFFGSIRDNIIMGHEAVSEEAIYRAADLAGVIDFIKGSPEGLDTQIGERGELISGGQRQSIAIARALLYDPPILILDEPTSSIDPKSEKKLYGRLIEICKNKTVILITHRSSLLGLVDKLALMDHGKIIDYGLRDNIIKGLQEKRYEPASRGGVE